MTRKKFRHPLYNTRRINPVCAVSLAPCIRPQGDRLRLALKILHDIEEPIIHVWQVVELHLDLVKVAESVL